MYIRCCILYLGYYILYLMYYVHIHTHTHTYTCTYTYIYVHTYIMHRPGPAIYSIYYIKYYRSIIYYIIY